jgi:hypothetical protein
MKLPKLLLLATLFSMPLAATMAPASALVLNAGGWAFSPVTGAGTPDGECVDPLVDYSCYTGLTTVDITIIGQDAPGPAPTYSYVLNNSSTAQQVTFSYFYDPNSNADSAAYYQVGAATNQFNPGTGGTAAFTWNPGELLAFYIEQNSDASWTGELSITSFSSQNAAPVPAPLPMAGAVALMGWSRTLRRRVRAAADSGYNRP